MAKRIALYDFVEVDGQDVSSLCRSLEFESEDQEVDVSGFNPTGASEFLQGTRVRAVTCEFYGSRGANDIHQTVFHIHDARGTCDFVWRADSNLPVSATNEGFAAPSASPPTPKAGRGARRRRWSSASWRQTRTRR